MAATIVSTGPQIGHSPSQSSFDSLPRQLTTATASGNSLTVSGGSTLDTEDLELILRALDVLERLTQGELASKQQDAELINTWSRLLIVRAKVSAMRVTP